MDNKFYVLTGEQLLDMAKWCAYDAVENTDADRYGDVVDSSLTAYGATPLVQRPEFTESDVRDAWNEGYELRGLEATGDADDAPLFTEWLGQLRGWRQA